MNFNNEYIKIKNLVITEIDIIEDKIVNAINLAEPLNSSIKRFLLAPSKRVREVLPIIFFKAMGKNISEKQLELLSVIELIHNASLIHDDIIDDSKVRRGIETISSEFGNKLGIVSGDYILSRALKKLCRLNNIQVIENCANTIGKMCIGEINQNFTRFKKDSLENYIEKTKNKTAYLFELAFVNCALLDENNNYNLESISSFALNTGIAFQIRDDIMNMLNVDNMSKPVNNDIKDGIYNAPVILGNEEDNYASGIEKTIHLLNNYIKDAGKEIQNFPDNQYKSALKKYLEILGNV